MAGFFEDGYQTLISFSANPAVLLKEKSVTPPGWDGGDAIDITTMRNTDLRTFALRKLRTLTESTFNAAFAAGTYSDLAAMINVNQEITITFPEGSSITFWGGLRTFTPGEFVEGEQPTAECAITPTNKNAAGVETLPVVNIAA